MNLGQCKIRWDGDSSSLRQKEHEGGIVFSKIEAWRDLKSWPVIALTRTPMLCLERESTDKLFDRLISGKKMAVCLASLRDFHLSLQASIIEAIEAAVMMGLATGMKGSGPQVCFIVPALASSSASSLP